MFGEQVGQCSPAPFFPRQIPFAFDAVTTVAYEAFEIVDRHMVDVGGVVPAVRQLLRHRHPPAEHVGKADFPLREIGERDKGEATNAEQLVKNQVGPPRGL